jgi:hypothetical protein
MVKPQAKSAPWVGVRETNSYQQWKTNLEVSASPGSLAPTS